MNLVIWSKTILSVYRYLETIVDAIDDLVLKQGVHSNLAGYEQNNSAFNCANRMIELTERKIKLINLKVVMEDALANLKRDEMRILVLFYFDMVKSKDIASMMNISIRTFFRKKSFAIQNFSKNLSLLGVTNSKIKEFLESELWLKNAYEINMNKQEHEFSDEQNLKDFKMLKYVLKDLNKVSNATFNYL